MDSSAAAAAFGTGEKGAVSVPEPAMLNRPPTTPESMQDEPVYKHADPAERGSRAPSPAAPGCH